MTETPEQTATRLMQPAGSEALWNYAKVKALLIKAIEEERAAQRSNSLPANPK